ncbi:hypothetical protein LCL86_12070 [Muricauda ruestringensis]|nr:hypothetical protein [Allomuricauda ruestringensis]
MEQAREHGLGENLTLIGWEIETNNTKAITFYRSLRATVQTKDIAKWEF